MAGYADHRDALKPQNMKMEERIYNVSKKKKTNNGLNDENKIFPYGDTSLIDNMNVMKHGMEVEKKIGRPLSYASVEIFDSLILDFVKYCDEKKMVPTRPGLALWLGIDSTTLGKWKNDSTNPFSSSIKNAEELFHSFLLQKTTEGKINTILYFFLAKNWYGMSDKTEIVHKSQSTQVIDISEQQRILRSTPGVVVDAEFEDLGTENLGTENLAIESVSGTENLGTENLGTENLGTSENLDDILLGAENLGTENLGTENLGTPENLDTYTHWDDDL